MKPTVYLETTIPSYLVARPGRDLVRAARQEVTQEWWLSRRARFDAFISQVVVDEAQAGDPDAATRRLEVLVGIPVLDLTPEAVALASDLVRQGSLPPKAMVDALHIAVSTISGMDYLLIWNCTHIANAEMRNMIEQVCRSSGYAPPIICTPDELMGGEMP
jgi:hypothetical protein